MADWNRNDPRRQFAAAVKSGWPDFFARAGKAHRLRTEILMAVASRETNIGNIVGDGGHGHGIMRIDDGSFPAWCHSGLWRDAQAAIMKGAFVFNGRRETIRQGQGGTLKFAGISLVGKPNLSDGDPLRVSIASCNCGMWAYCNFSRPGDPDRRTTGKDYSADTLARSSVLPGLLSAG